MKGDRAMKILTVTVESSVTKNLGNYQSTKQVVSMTVEMNQEIDPAVVHEELAAKLGMLTNELWKQMVDQLRAGESTIEASKEQAF